MGFVTTWGSCVCSMMTNGPMIPRSLRLVCAWIVHIGKSRRKQCAPQEVRYWVLLLTIASIQFKFLHWQHFCDKVRMFKH